MDENDILTLPPIDHPRTSYWLSKIYGEFLTIMSGLPYTIFRIFNMYGPNMKTTHVIPSIFFKLRNKKKPVFQNPSHTRCFLFIDDGISLMLDALRPSYKNKVINIANPYEEIKVKDLVYKIKNILNIKKKVTFKNIKNQSITRRCPSIKKIKKLKKTKIKFTKLDQGLLLLKNIMKIKISKSEIADNKRPFYVAEAGINYDGNFQKCFQLIDAAKAAGADAIKFQTHIAEHEMIDTNITLAHSKKKQFLI